MGESEHFLDDWLIRAKRKTNAHARCASRCHILHRLLGIPSVALSAVTGTAVVAQKIARDPNEWTWWVVGLVIVVAMLSSIQTFLDYGSLSERHKAASAGFSSLRRRIQYLKEREVTDTREIDRIREAFDELVTSEPIIPTFVWRDVEKKYPRG